MLVRKSGHSLSELSISRPCLLSLIGPDFFVECETECTVEKARGQFSIFGAVEEIVAGGL
jgi:hypothetical protein